MTAGCPSFEQLAAHASGDPTTRTALADHLSSCLTCRALVHEQRSIVELARRLPVPTLTRVHRDRLAAEVIAKSDQLDQQPAPGRSILRTRVVAATAIAAAFAIGVGIAALVSGSSGASGARTPDTANRTAPVTNRTADNRTPDNRTPDNRTPDTGPDNRTPDTGPDNRTPDTGPDNRTPDNRTPDTGPDSRTPPNSDRATRARVEGQGGQLSREGSGRSDQVRVADGEVTIDARGARPVEITTVGTRVRIGDAKVAVVAKRGVVETVTVIAGTVEVTSHGRRQVIESGTIWERDHAVDAAFEAFRDGWTALRERNFEAAIAAFDRAADSVVAEDARYWAAVASERAGQKAEARRRFEEFVAKFPTSPRGDAARAALARLAK